MQSSNENKRKSIFNIFTNNPDLVRKLKLYSTIIWIVNIVLFLIFSVNTEQWKILSGLGGKCLDLEDEDFSKGARVIAYECFTDKATQNFHFEKNNIKINSKCLDTQGKGDDGDYLVLRACNDSQSQKWQYKNDHNVIVNAYGKCIDLLGGSEHWGNYQVATIWSCNGRENQKWYLSKFESKKKIKTKNVILSGELGTIKASKKVVAERSGDLNYTNASKDGVLLSDDNTSVINTGKKYLVPAGVVSHDVFY